MGKPFRYFLVSQLILLFGLLGCEIDRGPTMESNSCLQANYKLKIWESTPCDSIAINTGEKIKPDIAINMDSSFIVDSFEFCYRFHAKQNPIFRGIRCPDLDAELDSLYPIPGGRWTAFTAESSVVLPDILDGYYGFFNITLQNFPFTLPFPDTIVEAFTGRLNRDSTWADIYCKALDLDYPQCMAGVGVSLLPDTMSLEDTCACRGSEITFSFMMLNTTEKADSFNASAGLATDAEGTIWEWSSPGLVYLEGYGDTLLTFNVTLPETIYGGQRAYIMGLVSDLSGEDIDAGSVFFDICSAGGVGDTEVDGILRTFSLQQNYPNPFNSTTAISYQLSALRGQLSAVSLKIYNILGQEVVTLVDSRQKGGTYQVVWDGRDSGGKEVASGIYFYRLEVIGDRLKAVKTRRMVLIR